MKINARKPLIRKQTLSETRKRLENAEREIGRVSVDLEELTDGPWDLSVSMYDYEPMEICMHGPDAEVFGSGAFEDLITEAIECDDDVLIERVPLMIKIMRNQIERLEKAAAVAKERACV